MRLLELIPTPDADPAAMDTIAHFCDLHMGKGVVYAKDTPNFIANRIGTFSILNVMRIMQEMDLSVEEVDALTGTAVGWPKTATFRLGRSRRPRHSRPRRAQRHHQHSGRAQRSQAARHSSSRCWSASGWATRPRAASIKKQKARWREAKSSLSTGRRLNIAPSQRPKFPALEMAKNVEDLPERLRTLLAPSKDKANIFLWSVLSDLWTYAANRIGEISDSVVEIDRAMKLGFNWEMGPFELWDAAGVAKTVKRMQVEGKPVSPNVEKLLASGHDKLVCRRSQSRQRSRLFRSRQQATISPRKSPQESGRLPSRRNPVSW